MKIVIGTSTPFHLGHLARELAVAGHDVTVIGYMPKWKMKKYNLESAKYISLFWKLFPMSFLALQRFFGKKQRDSVFNIMPLIDKEITKSMPECDVFIGLSGVIVESFTIAKEKYKAITICERGSAHVETQSKLILAEANKSLPPLYIQRELKGYELSDVIAIPSIFAAKTFYEKGFKKDKIFINNYGVNLNRFKINNRAFKQNTNNKTINGLFVGAWSYQKGVDLLSAALLKDKNLQITQIGMNGGEKFPDIDRFHKIGYVPNTKLANFYQQFDVLFLPSRQDGFGMVLLEALACNIPVIASKNTGAPDIKKRIEKKEYVEIMEDITVEALLISIQNIKQVLTQQNKIILSDNDKKQFSWEFYGQRYNKFLNNKKRTQ